MRIGLIILFFILMSVALWIIPSGRAVYAAGNCNSQPYFVSLNPNNPIPKDATSLSIIFQNLPSNDKYFVEVGFNGTLVDSNQVQYTGGSATFTLNQDALNKMRSSNGGNFTFNGYLWKGDPPAFRIGGSGDTDICEGINIQLVNPQTTCQMNFDPNYVVPNTDIKVNVTGGPAGTYDIIDANKTILGSPTVLGNVTIGSNGSGTGTIPSGTYKDSDVGNSYELALADVTTDPQSGATIQGQTFCNTKLVVNSPTDPNKVKSGGSGGTTTIPACTGNDCSSGGGIYCNVNGSDGVKTALGCIPVKPDALIPVLITFAIGIGGGIALILMIIGAFRMMLSMGNPEALAAGRQQFISAVIGLLFVIFSYTLLQILSGILKL